MTYRSNYYSILVLSLIFLWTYHSEQRSINSSQVQIMLRIQALLNYPPFLNSWKKDADFCNMEPNLSVTVVCYDERITQLHVTGKNRAVLLPSNFSIDSFFSTLVELPNLKVLTLVSLGLWGSIPAKIGRLLSLEIMNISSNFLYGEIPRQLLSLSSLQTLILDDNRLAGRFPVWLSMLQDLTVVSLRKNYFNGSLPNSLSGMENLRILALSHNRFYGDVPDLRHLTNLQVLDLENNEFGPQFPQLGNKLITLIMGKNRFRSGVPAEVSSYHQLQQLDLSFNTFVGPFPPILLSLPSLTYLNIAENKLTGMLFENSSCSNEIKFVDLTANLLTGTLPKCLLQDILNRVVLYGRNCLDTTDQNQHPLSFCDNEALAVGILPQRKKPKGASKAILPLAIVGGFVGGVVFIGLIIFIIRRMNTNPTPKKPPSTFLDRSNSTGHSSKALSDAGYMSKSMKIVALSLSAYRTFSLEELEEATDNFHSSAFMGGDSHGQMYRGQLRDGSFVAIRCLKMKNSHTAHSLTHHTELFSKLRHRHLVCAIGHCFECYLDDSTVSRFFLIFEYIPNGNLRSWISGGSRRRPLTWTQRIGTAIGITKGIQYLHTGIVPGIYSSNIKITDILLDQNLVAKISSYNLPLLTESIGEVDHGISSSGFRDPNISARINPGAQIDIYHFGVILLEMILGKPVKSRNELDLLKNMLELGVSSDDSTRRRIVDPAVQTGCLDQSLKTMMEICVRCLMEDTPSLEDVLWNLQFAAQVQEAWFAEPGQSSENSPNLQSLEKNKRDRRRRRWRNYPT